MQCNDAASAHQPARANARGGGGGNLQGGLTTPRHGPPQVASSNSAPCGRFHRALPGLRWSGTCRMPRSRGTERAAPDICSIERHRCRAHPLHAQPRRSYAEVPPPAPATVLCSSARRDRSHVWRATTQGAGGIFPGTAQPGRALFRGTLPPPPWRPHCRQGAHPSCRPRTMAPFFQWTPCGRQVTAGSDQATMALLDPVPRAMLTPCTDEGRTLHTLHAH